MASPSPNVPSPTPTTPSPKKPSPSQQSGQLGEAFIAAWWKQQGWTIIAQRWSCRWGELDVVVRSPEEPAAPRPRTLAFVEVKTRRNKNWDQDGLLALTPTKQTKLIRTAQTFLGQFPDFSEDACRFDVAAVRCDRPSPRSPLTLPDPLDLSEHSLHLSPGHPHLIYHHRLTLQHYIPDAFDLS